MFAIISCLSTEDHGVGETLKNTLKNTLRHIFTYIEKAFNSPGNI